MGRLTPNATYIYERVGDEVYAREEGKTERVLIGYNLPNTPRDPLDYMHYQSSPNEAQLWHEIRHAAKSNPELQKALDRAKVLYYLSKEGKDDVLMWHPV